MTDRGDTRRVAGLARSQHGNVEYGQMIDAGMAPREIAARADAGWLIRRHTRTFAVGHVPRTRESIWMAAVLALGEGAVLSHRSAGAHYKMLSGSVPTEVIVPTTAGRPRRDGIVVHRARLPEAHVTTRDGIPTTSALRTLLDLAAVLPLRALARAFEQAQVRLHLPPAPLAAEVISRPRHRGNGKLRVILQGAVDPAAVRSVLELRFLRLCDAHGIPRPLVNEKIGIWTPDFLWPQFALVVETDGHDFHRTAAARRRDARKDEFMRAQGLTVIRFTWADVTARPIQAAARIRAATSVA